MDTAVLWPMPDVRGRWEKLMALLDPRPGESVLDVGFGHGQAMQYVAARVGPTGHVIGIEPHIGQGASVESISAAERTAVARRLRADAQALPFKDGTFDAVLCVNVLEAVPDRHQSLVEMRRVLKPGGRVLVAHDDYESQIYACSDRELGRRVALAYASATFEVYATSDGQMGRHLWGLFRRGGFRGPRLDVLPLVNTEYCSPFLGWVLAQFPVTLVASVSDLTQEELDRWRADLEARSACGDYVYCLNLYVCRGLA